MATALETRDEQSVAYDVVSARLRAIDDWRDEHPGTGDGPDVGVHLDAAFVASVETLSWMVVHAAELLKTAASAEGPMTTDEAARLWYAGDGLCLSSHGTDEYGDDLKDAANAALGALFEDQIQFAAFGTVAD